MPKDYLEISQRIYEKFYFYFLSLTFVVLGLSIQTANFVESSYIADCFELIGWVCLFTAGIYGLFNIRRAPRIFTLLDSIQDYDSKGGVVAEEARTKHVGLCNRELKKHSFRRGVHTWGFVVGLFFLICSRGLEPALGIVDWLRGFVTS